MNRRKVFSIGNFPSAMVMLNKFSESRDFINFAYDENSEYPIFFRIPRELPLDRNDRPIYPFSRLERSYSFPYATSCWFSPDSFPERFLDYVKVFLSGKIESISEEALVFEITEPKDATHFFYLIDFYREEGVAKLFGDSLRALNSLVQFKFVRSYCDPGRPIYTYCLVTKADVSASFGANEDEISFVPIKTDFQKHYEDRVKKEAEIYYENIRQEEVKRAQKEEQEEIVRKNKGEIEQLMLTKFQRYAETNFRKLPEIIRSELGRKDLRFDYYSTEFSLAALERELEKAAGVYNVAERRYRSLLERIVWENSSDITMLSNRGLERLRAVPDYDFSGVEPFLKLVFLGLEREVQIKPSEDEPFEERAVRLGAEAIAKLLKELTRKELVEKTLARLTND